MNRIIFYIDINSAFLSWKAAKRVKNRESGIRKIASCIDGEPTTRKGVVLAKSNKAKNQGVKTGKPLSFSIDECFLDIAEIANDFKHAVRIAHEIKDRIKNELSFTVNLGIGENKLCVKMASDFENPDKVHTLFLSEVPSKMWGLPVGNLLFVGGASAKKLNSSG